MADLSSPFSAWSDAHLFALTRDTQFLSQPVAGDWFDSRPHLLILYTLAKWVCWQNPSLPAPLAPPVCMEIGVRHGMTSVALLHAMRETSGHLTSIEIDPHWCAESQKVVDRIGLDPWWTLRCADSNTFEPGVEFVDILFIDGDHSRDQVEREVLKYGPLVRVNGFMLMHDYWSRTDCLGPPVTDPGSQVSEVVEEIMRPSGEWEIVCLPWSHGLVIARRVRPAA